MKPEIYFAQIREDGRLERALRDEHASRRIACIGSGGCTALSLLDDRVERVWAIDQNPAQCALIELKKEAIRVLDRDAFLAFIGVSATRDRKEIYIRIAPRLPAYAREFWDRHPDELAGGVNRCGATERFHRFVGTGLRSSVCDEVWRELLSCGSLDRQRELYDRHFRGERWQGALRRLLSRSAHLEFFPAWMFAHATEDDFGGFFARQFEQEACSRPLRGNYFLSQLLFGSYLEDQPDGMPRYLCREGYAAAGRNLDKLVVVPGALAEVLDQAERVDAFFLSNVFDWATPEGRERIGEAVLRAKVSERAVLLQRNMLSAHPLSAPLRQRLVVDHAGSTRLRRMERSMQYQAVIAGALR